MGWLRRGKLGEFAAACLFGECLIGLNYTHAQTQAFSAEVQNE